MSTFAWLMGSSAGWVDSLRGLCRLLAGRLGRVSRGYTEITEVRILRIVEWNFFGTPHDAGSRRFMQG